VRVERADRLASTLDRALRTAVAGRPGPVLVELPNDVMAAPQAPLADGAGAPTLGEGVAGIATADAIALTAESSRPAIIAGNGARMAGARKALVQLAERLGAPVGVTAMGRGSFPEQHPLFAGIIGWMSDREDGSGAVANRVFPDADLVLAFGSALDHVTTDGERIPAPGVPLVRVDLDPDRLALTATRGPAILADARAAASALLTALGEAPPQEGWAPLAALWSDVRSAQRRTSALGGDAAVQPARLFEELRSILEPEDLVVCDAAYSSVWPLSYLEEGRHFAQMTYGRAAGTLGFGLPAAIGAGAAFPDRRVIALVGDGGFGFGWGELETVAREGLPVVCVVLNNGCFAYQKLWHTMNKGVSRGLDFGEVRHDRLAEAVGIPGHLVERPEQLAPALAGALGSRGPALIDVRIDPEALPPFNLYRHLGE
jgi:acetolactate synthase I/II/III large subunit